MSGIRVKRAIQLQPGEQFYFAQESYLNVPDLEDLDSMLHLVIGVEDFKFCVGLHTIMFPLGYSSEAENITIYEGIIISKMTEAVILTKKNLSVNKTLLDIHVSSECEKDLDSLETLEQSGHLSAAMKESIVEMCKLDIEQEIADEGREALHDLYNSEDELDLSGLPLYIISELDNFGDVRLIEEG